MEENLPALICRHCGTEPKNDGGKFLLVCECTLFRVLKTEFCDLIEQKPEDEQLAYSVELIRDILRSRTKCKKQNSQ